MAKQSPDRRAVLEMLAKAAVVGQFLQTFLEFPPRQMVAHDFEDQRVKPVDQGLRHALLAIPETEQQVG